MTRRSGAAVRRIALLWAALAALASAFALAACGASGTTPSVSPTAGARAVTITGVLPLEAAVEPPWNGRFIQITIRAPEPGTMDERDWSVFVNGKEQPLAKPPAVLPYAADAATVVFVLREPFGDLGDYRFRVVYAPPDGAGVVRAWDYDWAP